MKKFRISNGRIVRLSGSVFSNFGKGNERSIAGNFGRSSGKNCSRACPHHKNSVHADPTFACYSSTSELMRPSVRSFLDEQEERGALETIGLMVIEFQELATMAKAKNTKIDWVRFSSAGSVPEKNDIPLHERKRFEILLRLFCKLVRDAGAKIHFPVETETKRDYYQGIVGELAVVRLSCHSAKAFEEQSPSSTVVGKHITNKTSKQVKLDRLNFARELAKSRYLKTGRKTIVCPAIVANVLKRDPIHCGTCDACANKNIDVIYPLHV